MRLKKFYFLLVCALAIAAMPRAAHSIRAFDGEAYAIKGGTVVTVTGETIRNGVVVIRKGLITAVGADVAIPADARVVDATGMMVYPGLFDSLTGYGIRPPAQPQSPPGAGGGDPIQMFMAQMMAPQTSAGLLPEVTVVDQLRSARTRSTSSGPPASPPR